jgi:hypothetical protein
LHQPPQLDDETGASPKIRRQAEGFEILNVRRIQRNRTVVFSLQ